MNHNKCFFSFLQTERTCVRLLFEYFSAQLDRSVIFLYVLSIMQTPVAFACCGCCNLLITLKNRQVALVKSKSPLIPRSRTTKNKTKQKPYWSGLPSRQQPPLTCRSSRQRTFHQDLSPDHHYGSVTLVFWGGFCKRRKGWGGLVELACSSLATFFAAGSPAAGQ